MIQSRGFSVCEEKYDDSQDLLLLSQKNLNLGLNKKNKKNANLTEVNQLTKGSEGLDFAKQYEGSPNLLLSSDKSHNLRLKNKKIRNPQVPSRSPPPEPPLVEQSFLTKVENRKVETKDAIDNSCESKCNSINVQKQFVDKEEEVSIERLRESVCSSSNRTKEEEEEEEEGKVEVRNFLETPAREINFREDGSINITVNNLDHYKGTDAMELKSMSELEKAPKSKPNQIVSSLLDLERSIRQPIERIKQLDYKSKTLMARIQTRIDSLKLIQDVETKQDLSDQQWESQDDAEPVLPEVGINEDDVQQNQVVSFKDWFGGEEDEEVEAEAERNCIQFERNQNETLFDKVERLRKRVLTLTKELQLDSS